MTRQTRSTKTRAYSMSKRAEDVDRTRLRIVEAAVRLHARVGPRAPLSDIAAEAGVTRATLYRHFADAEALLGACSAHWAGQQRFPDPEAWTADPDPAVRLRTALADIYRYYAEGSEMLRQVTADPEALPAWLRRQGEEEAARLVDALLALVDVRRGRRALAAAVVGHAIDFTTWDSLVTRHGVPPDRAVELMAGLVEEVLA